MISKDYTFIQLKDIYLFGLKKYQIFRGYWAFFEKKLNK